MIKTPKQVAYKTLGFLKQCIKLAKEDKGKKKLSVEKMKEGLSRR
jgi:hypothetical protein